MSRKAQLVVLLLVVAAFTGVVFVASASEPPASSDAAKVERGRYLLSIMGCGDCHTPKKMTEMGPVEDSTMLFSGHLASDEVGPAPTGLGTGGWIAAGNGNFTAWTGPWGVSFAANLTSDPKTGIGNWTDDQFIKAMRTGKHRGFGRSILPPMPWPNLSHATDEDLSAILAFLKTTKPIANQVPEPMPPAGK